MRYQGRVPPGNRVRFFYRFVLNLVYIMIYINLNIDKIFDIDGVFVAIGHDPATSVFKGKINLDNDNYVITNKGETSTSVPGIFAAGDCVDKIYRQAVTAAGMGCMAALDAEKWLAENQ